MITRNQYFGSDILNNQREMRNSEKWKMCLKLFMNIVKYFGMVKEQFLPKLYNR